MRYHYISVIRIFAMLSVIALHTVLPPVTYFSDLYTPFQLKLSVFVLNTFEIFCVPLFFMISGALMLNPNKEITIDKILKKTLRIVTVLFIIGTFYAFIEIVVTKPCFKIGDVFKSFFLMLADKSWAHLWYLYVLVGLYLITPILRSAIHSNRGYLLTILFIFNVCLPFLSYILGLVLKPYGWNGIAFNLPICGIAVFYYVLGYSLHSGAINFSNKSALCIITILVVYEFLGCFVFDFIKDKSKILFWDINSLSGVLFSTCLYALLKNNIHEKCDSPLEKYLSDTSFGIYIFHAVFTNFSYQFLKLNPSKLNLMLK